MVKKKVITLSLKLVVFIVCLCFQAHVSSISAVYFCFVSDIQQLHDRYNAIIDSLFREFPYLANGEGIALQSARAIELNI